MQTLWYLSEADTRWACGRIDSVEIVRATLTSRSPRPPAGGRAGGLIVLVDPGCVMAATPVAEVRSAAVTVASAQALLCQPVITVGVVGAGEAAVANVELLASTLTGVAGIAVYDPDAELAERMRDRTADLLWRHGVRLSLTESAREAVLGADLVVAALGGAVGAIEHSWLSPGAVVVDLSTDGVLPCVVHEADLLLVDDWSLVTGVLGRMRAAGELDAEGAGLGDVLAGAHPGRRDPEAVILVCPYGPAVLDVALATEACRAALLDRRGIALPT
ncbi:hypothetical protein ACIBG8_36240 [Nonomuraea sp. NPDC050556]|uniref:hypothetical protein n=1 Tax=Nonomuraea sp. NPDC050556 TaxID=3364369 RepID=UPI00379C95DC